jgi:hypothetical protein
MKIRNILIASTIFVSIFSVKAAAASNVTVNGTNTLAATSTTSDSSIKFFQQKYDVAVDKTWTIKFNKQLDSNTFKADSIQVLDSNGQSVSVKVVLNSDNTSVSVLPPDSKYESGQTYCLVIKKSLLSKDNAQLSKETRMNFTIVKSSSTNSGSTINTDPTLIKAQSELPKVQNEVKTQAEKDLVSALISAVNTKMNDSSAVIDTTPIKTKYNSLSSSELSDFRNAMLNNFTIGELFEIKDKLMK